MEEAQLVVGAGYLHLRTSSAHEFLARLVLGFDFKHFVDPDGKTWVGSFQRVQDLGVGRLIYGYHGKVHARVDGYYPLSVLPRR